jgi:hypothetical protein
MTSDPNLPFADNPADVRELTIPNAASTTAGPLPTTSAARVWLRRFGVLLFVFLCATLGVMLMIVPWRAEWSDNPLLLPYPELRTMLASGFARGIATGLGVLNVWIGFWEAVQYRE